MMALKEKICSALSSTFVVKEINLVFTIKILLFTFIVMLVNSCMFKEDKIRVIHVTSNVTIEAMEISITDNLDDGQTGPDAGFLYLPDGEGAEKVYCGNWYVYDKPTWCFFRFKLTLNIPSNSTIRNATLSTFGVGTAGSWNNSTDSLIVYGNDSDNSPQVTVFEDTIGEANGNISTVANVRWPESGGLNWNTSGLNTTPDISSIIQELVDKYGGLAKDSYIQLWLVGPNYGHNGEIIFADTGHADFDTKLYIEYEY